MKSVAAVLLAFALAGSSFAQGAAAKSAPSPKSESPAVVTLAASAGVVTAPLVLKDGAFSQPEQTELAGGGKAVFEFSLAKAGNYVIRAVVNAGGEDANSFYVNVDAQPKDPLMIWDCDVTSGFEERTVSWRGRGSPEQDEISPKVFHLSAGAHKLIIVGREPAQLKSISVHAVAN
jgi:hypothetical protein